MLTRALCNVVAERSFSWKTAGSHWMYRVPVRLIAELKRWSAIVYSRMS